MAILLPGGAGYIGSHTAVELLNSGKEIVIIDNFSNSKPEVLDKVKTITGKDFKFYEMDYRDKDALDKVFSENPNWRPAALLDRMEEAFQAEIVLLPWDMKEPYGHSDGMVASLGDGRILLNNYRQMEKERGKPLTKRLIKILDYHFDIVELKYDCVPSDDSWCYLNYLEIGRAHV